MVRSQTFQVLILFIYFKEQRIEVLKKMIASVDEKKDFEVKS